MLSRRELAGLVALFVVSLPAVTARHLLVGRNAVLFVSAIALVRPRRLVRERVSILLRSRRGADARVSEATFLEPRTPIGPRVNFGTIGSALLWAPFYALGDDRRASSRARPGERSPRDGFSQPYIVAVTYASALYGFLAVLSGMAAVLSRGG